MGATRILLVRHGQSEGNAAGIWQGTADFPLTGLGEAQARAAVRRLQGAGLEAVRCSELRRARRTAELLAEGLGLAEPTVVEGFAERDVGSWTGRTRAEIEARWPGAFGTPRMEPPGGEAREAMEDRVGAAVRALVAAEAGRTVAVVTHGGVIRALEVVLGAERGPIPNLVGWWLRAETDADGIVIQPGERLLLVDPDDVNVTMPLAP